MGGCRGRDHPGIRGRGTGGSRPGYIRVDDSRRTGLGVGRLRAAVADVVARQRDTGIGLVNDGEFGHLTGMNI
jgi:hypothetical protein